MAFVYAKLGDFINSEQIYDEALLNLEMQLGTDHYLYGKLLNNVGKLYSQMGEYRKGILIGRLLGRKPFLSLIPRTP